MVWIKLTAVIEGIYACRESSELQILCTVRSMIALCRLDKAYKVFNKQNNKCLNLITDYSNEDN